MNAYKQVLSLIFPNCCNFQDAEQQNLAIYALEVFIIVIEIALLIYLGNIKAV